jgi:hypothetical protein
MDQKQCATCEKTKALSDFPAQFRRSGSLYYRPHCYSCKYGKEVLSGRVTDKQYLKEYYNSNKLAFKYKAYRHNDLTRFDSPCETISRDKAVELMMQPCIYCGVEKSHGLDRKDSSKGHSEDNVVPCCEKCNFILGDLPNDAKVLLKTGLTNIRKKGYFETWTIPTKRKRKKQL